jgi:hypothetical protein
MYTATWEQTNPAAAVSGGTGPLGLVKPTDRKGKHVTLSDGEHVFSVKLLLVPAVA